MPNFEKRDEDWSNRMHPAVVVEEQMPAAAERELVTSDTDKETRKPSGARRIFQEHPWKAIFGLEVVQRVPVRIDFDRPPGQDIDADELLKPGLCVGPDVRLR
jgi:hypothetical protein